MQLTEIGRSGSLETDRNERAVATETYRSGYLETAKAVRNGRAITAFDTCFYGTPISIVLDGRCIIILNIQRRGNISKNARDLIIT